MINCLDLDESDIELKSHRNNRYGWITKGQYNIRTGLYYFREFEIPSEKKYGHLLKLPIDNCTVNVYIFRMK